MFYGYEGFDKPRVLAKSLKELKAKIKNGDVVVSDPFLGDAREDLLDILEHSTDVSNDLVSYNIFSNKRDMQDANISWGLDADTHLEGI